MYRWAEGKHAEAEAVMLADGLAQEVEALRASQTLGVWYLMTREAVEAVGPRVVAASARQAKQELEQYAGR